MLHIQQRKWYNAVAKTIQLYVRFICICVPVCRGLRSNTRFQYEEVEKKAL